MVKNHWSRSSTKASHRKAFVKMGLHNKNVWESLVKNIADRKLSTVYVNQTNGKLRKNWGGQTAFLIAEV